MSKCIVSLCLFVLVGSIPGFARCGEAPPHPPSRGELIQRADGQSTAGKLTGDPVSGFRFESPALPRPVRLEPGSVLTFEGPGIDPSRAAPAFRVELGLERRISGQLTRIDETSVVLEQTSTRGPITIARPGVRAIVQRLGEMQLFDDGFETLNSGRWTLVGDPQIVSTPRVAGAHSLRVPAGGTSLTTRLAEAVEAGRLEIAFRDDGEVALGQQWFVDLLFRSPGGLETVRAILGWSEESLSVESPGGPALAVQRLPRKNGWHRLNIRFSPDQTEISVDANELAHGKGPGGPLVEIRLASYNSSKNAPADGLAGVFDDLRLVRFIEPLTGLEVDPSQDEVRLSGGDQIFGTIRGADADRVLLKSVSEEISLPWSEVAGVYFRRSPLQGKIIAGLLVRVDWRTAPGDDPRDLDQAEGALVGLSESELTLETAYAGRLQILRERVRRIQVVGSGHRLVVDPTPHHLGNEIVGSPLPLDPPQPEGRLLERTFELAEVPAGASYLSLDVVQVVGESNGLPFSDLVKKGEIRTNVSLNGKKIDYLNRYITSKNETPERIRIPIPVGLLHKGSNRVRLEQSGKSDDPDYLDDLGVLEIALEYAGAPLQGADRQKRP